MIINNLVTKLYSSQLLSGDHKGCIDSLPTTKEKTEYFLDKVIKPGLEIEYTEQFDEMLRVMRNSDDPAVNYLVDKIQKFTSTTMSSVDQNQTTCKGDYYSALYNNYVTKESFTLDYVMITFMLPF